MKIINPVFELVALLTLNSDKFKNGMKDAQGEAESGGSGIGKALGTAAKVGAAALAAATTAAVAFGKSSVEAGMTFDSSMSQVAATMGYTVDELNDANSEAAQNMAKLGEFAQEMGRTTAFSASEAADALNYMALAGYGTNQSMQMLPTVLDLAAAGNMDLARASDMVTDAQSALGLKFEETSTMVDQMAKAASKSNTSVEQLGDAFLTIGATARSVSGGTTELATVLGVLADNGIKGSEGGTHLRNMILSLQSPTKEATEILDKMNISLYDGDGNMRSLIDVIGDLQTGMEGMDQASKDAVIGGIFNKTDLAAVNALVGTSRDRFDELTTAIENSDGAAKAMAETQLDNLAGDITLFQSALEGAKIAVSENLTPALRDFVKFGTSSISDLTAAFKEGGLQGAVDALPPIIDQGIQLLFDALPKAMEAGLAILEGVVTGILNSLPELIEASIQIMTELVNDIVENLPKLLDAAVEIIFALVDGIIEALPELIPAVVEIILTIVEKLTEPSTLMQLIQAAFQIIAAVAKGLINSIPQIVSSGATIVLNLIEAILRFLPQLAASGLELMIQLALGIANGVVNVVRGVIDVVNGAEDAFMARVADARNWGRDLIGNFIQGIADMAANLWNSCRNVASGIKSFLGFSEPEKGPLSDFHTYAPDMMKLFAQGVKDNEGMLYDTVADAFDFGKVTVNSANTFGTGGSDESPITIIVQSVLDNKIIGESVTRYQRNMARAVG